MNYIIFDLEWNRYAKGVRAGCPDEIIQIGAVKYNAKLEPIDTFSRLIKPMIYKKMESTVERMTGITIELLEEEGVYFNKALKEFRHFMGNPPFVLMSWGMQDAAILRCNCLHYNKDIKLNFMTSYADLQNYASKTITGEKQPGQMGLSNAADACNIPYDEETLHNALVDAKLSGEVFVNIFDKEKFSPFIVDASKLNHHYKSLHITDIDNKMVDKKEFRVACPVCGRFVRKRQGWFKQGKKFISIHSCKHCGVDLLCTLEILLTYGNQVHYKKKCKVIEKTKI